MSSKIVSLSLLLTLAGITSCNESNFKASPQSKSEATRSSSNADVLVPKEIPQPDPDVEPEPAVDPSLADTTITITNEAKEIAAPFIVPPGTLNLKIETDSINKTETAQKVYPKLGIYFVIDRSSSMGPQLQSAKNGIQQFANALKSNGFAASFGAITFEDPVQDHIKLTDIASFNKSLSAITLASDKAVNGYLNHDVPEGGLGALLKASESLASELGETDDAPILVYVSDATAHQGSNEGLALRNCSPEPFLDSLQTAFGKRIKFFYSVNFKSIPYLSSEGCNFPAVNTQYDGIMSLLQEKSPGTYRGAKLSWPFNENVLSKELPKFLKDKIVKVDQLCRATDILLSADGLPLKEWTQDDFKTRDGGSIVLSQVLSDASLEKIRDAELVLDINRCCDADSSASCKQVIKQTVSFTIAK